MIVLGIDEGNLCLNTLGIGHDPVLQFQGPIGKRHYELPSIGFLGPHQMNADLIIALFNSRDRYITR